MYNQVLSKIFPARGFSLIDFSIFEEYNLSYDELQNKLNQFPNTYTPYRENRKKLFDNTYLNKFDEVIHLGRDIQVPAGTEVYCPVSGAVISKQYDEDANLGWGCRVDVLDHNDKLWIFGHLSKEVFKNNLRVEPGDLLGFVGDKTNNGNVFEHLHLQVCDFNHLFKNLTLSETIDGYGTKEDLKWHYDPFEISLLK